MEDALTKVRRYIHTYPFNFSRFGADEFLSPSAAAIYIHVPFCATKCHFCDFTVYTNKNEDVREKYVRSLCVEIQRFSHLRTFPEFKIEAVYIGGGTPGLLTGEQLVRLLQTCRDNYRISDGCEIAVEFDPSTVTAAKLDQLREAGFNRISIGVQTFDDKLLVQVNRTHDVATVLAAFEQVKRSGFTYSNLDLIYPLPGLTQEGWKKSVQQALAIEPACISLYGLQIWPGTAYYNWLKNDKLPLPTAADEVEMYLYAADLLESRGFLPGSTNGYYHPDRADSYCRYLDFYWRTWPLLGFGVSSSSAVHNRLWTNIKSIGEYVRRIEADEMPIDVGRFLTKPEEMRRVLIRGLKACEVSKEEFRSRFGVDMEMMFETQIRSLVRQGLIDDEPGRIVLTRRGRAFGPNVFEEFFVPDDLQPPHNDEIRIGVSTLVPSE